MISCKIVFLKRYRGRPAEVDTVRSGAQATAAYDEKTGSAGGPTTSACSARRTAQHSAGGFQRVTCVLVCALRVNSSASIILF